MVAFWIEDYVYHTLAAKASGELCLKYIFSFGAFARMPLLHRSVDVSLSLQCYFFVFLDKKKFEEEVFPLDALLLFYTEEWRGIETFT